MNAYIYKQKETDYKTFVQKSEKAVQYKGTDIKRWIIAHTCYDERDRALMTHQVINDLLKRRKKKVPFFHFS